MALFSFYNHPTIQENWSRINRGQKLVIVTHRRPDSDAIAAAYLVSKAFGMTTDKCVFKFVEPGKLLSQEEIPQNSVVVHVDTGGLLDKEILCFDHHDAESPYRSATDAVFNLLYPVDVMPWEFGVFVDTINYADDPQGRTIPQEVYDTINQLRAQIPSELRNIIMVNAERPGPIWLPRMLSNLSSNLSDEKRILYGCIMINTWFIEHRNLQTVQQFINETMMTQSNGDGLILAYFPENSFSTKLVRQGIRRWKHLSRNDVYVTISPGINDEDHGSAVYNVTVTGKQVTGMDDLKNRLLEHNPRLRDHDVFVHHNGFCLYARQDACDMALEHVFHLARATLRRAPITKANDLDEIDNDIDDDTAA